MGDSNGGLVDSQTISHYRIINKLGAGGMGEVYLAEDTLLNRKVAIKLLPEALIADEQAGKRLIREARAAATLDHTNICSVYEVGQDAGRTFIVMQYVEGETLAIRLARKPMDLQESLSVALQVAQALSEAHSRGIIHRDIKPQNIMLTARGHVKVLDFGLAKVAQTELSTDSEAATQSLLTEPGTIMGTVQYMSPEQVKGETLDARSDIFSFGVLLYEMIGGHHPFAAATPAATISAILTKEPPPLARYSREAPAELERLVSKALRKDREERYQGIKDVALDLKSLKEEMEFEVKLERSVSPDSSSAAKLTTSGRHAKLDSAENQAITTGEIAAVPTLSSAAYIVSEFKSHKKSAALAAAVFVIAVAAAIFFYLKPASALTEKDTILLSDFVNTTGDAAFDGALKQGLAMQLEQSPFMNIFSDERVRETLRLMGRSPDERVTKDVAREICQRQGLKAYFAGSISNLGSHLVITLEAVNAQTGDTLARQQEEAESKEQVLSTLGKAATKLREKLGESLASIQKYDAPFEATTSSLEALKAYSLGLEQHGKGNISESILLFKRAIELDPNFARAYSSLAIAYSNTGQQQLAIEAEQKAFELRDRTSEFEKLRIASDYYTLVTRDQEKAIEALELLKRTYPRDYGAHNGLAFRYNTVGRYEQAIEEAREAIRLNPNLWNGYFHLAVALRSLNRFDEAKEIYKQALAQKVDIPSFHASLRTIAFVQGDTAAMQQQLDWARGKPDEQGVLLWQAETTAYLGQLRRARELNQRGVDAQLSRNLKENAARRISLNALSDAVTGNCQQAREGVARASALPRTDVSFSRIGIALALCGELGQAQSLADEYAKQYPKDTLVNAVWLPAIRAAIEIRRNNPAQAIQFLQSATRYDRTGDYWPEYLRGQAYLAQHAGAEAAAEFQKILDRRGLAPISVLYPLAHLGLARAAMLEGDTTKARKSYQDFFALWKDADEDIPILIEAKKEYEKVR
jgi:serine/threonine protein kinase/tetratricopeptide (TPR) repeat protein